MLTLSPQGLGCGRDTIIKFIIYIMFTYLKTAAYSLLAVAILVFAYGGIQYMERPLDQETLKDWVLGGQGGLSANACTIFSQSEVTVNATTSTEVVASHARNAWVRIEQKATAADIVYLGFGQAATSTSGLTLATSTADANDATHIDLGLNTDFPYTGAVNALTDSATTTVNVVVCRY